MTESGGGGVGSVIKRFAVSGSGPDDNKRMCLGSRGGVGVGGTCVKWRIL